MALLWTLYSSSTSLLRWGLDAVLQMEFHEGRAEVDASPPTPLATYFLIYSGQLISYF